MLKKTHTSYYGFFAFLLLMQGTFTLHLSAAKHVSHPDLVALAHVSTPLAQVEVGSLLETIEPVAPVEREAAPAEVSEELLWLARAIYSETKRPDEQELVAWVVRNRVEMQYRGKDSYRDVVLDPYQFSAFNPGSRVRQTYMNLEPDTKLPGWRTAMRIAEHVIQADREDRPFSHQTMHFYSEQSMVGRRTPDWARGKQPVPVQDRELPAERFRFYARIA